jgi:threonine dehydrogenase-like Zn-dependent dehydrogenase
MRAIAVLPLKKDSVHLRECAEPAHGPDEVLVRVLETGICGTDFEINEGLYGTAPVGGEHLILGHESVGVVEEVGSAVRGFAAGDAVVATVRRACPGCENCARGFSDMCSTGQFTERGIVGAHGFMAEYFAEQPAYLVPVPTEQRSYGILLEPMSIVEKAVQQALRIQERLAWKPSRALVLGAGPIGLLATFLLRLRGFETFTLATRPPDSAKAALVRACGGTYLSGRSVPLEMGPVFDLIIEATGDSKVAFDAIALIGINGVLCLTSVTGGDKQLQIPADRLNQAVVLGNKVIFGTVNAGRAYFESGLQHFAEIEARWPGLLARLITRRFHVTDYRGAFEKNREITKAVITYAS